MTNEQHQVLAQLRHEGYAVIVWYPEELLGANPHIVEDRCVELGYQVIDDLANLGSEDKDKDEYTP